MNTRKERGEKSRGLNEGKNIKNPFKIR